MSRNTKPIYTNSASSSKKINQSEPVSRAQDTYYLKYLEKCHELRERNSEMENLRNQYLKSEQSREKYRNDNHRLSNENDQQRQLLREMKVIRENKEYFQYENDNLKKEIQSLKIQCQLSRDKRNETYQQMRRETQELEERNTKFEETISQLKRENYELKSNCSVLLQVSKELDHYHSKYDEKCQELKDLYNNYQKLEILCEKYKENYRKLRNENDQQKQKHDLQVFEEDLKSLQKKYDKQSTRLSKYKENYRKLRNENDQQKQKHDLQESSENDSYRFKYDDINQEVEKLKTEKEILFKNYQNSEIECRIFEEDLKSLQKKYDKQSTRLSKYKENYRKLRNENDQQKQKHDLQESSENDSYRFKYDDIYQEVEKLKTEKEILFKNYQNSEIECRKFQEDLNILQKKYDKQIKQLNNLISKLANSERIHGELEMNYDDLKSEHEKLKLTNSNTDKDNLSITSNSPIVYKDPSIIQLEEKVEALENENKNAFKKIDELEAEIQKKQNAIVTIRNKYKTLQNTNDELSGLTIFKAQSLSLQKQNEDFKCQLNTLTKSNENLNTNLELTKNENNQLKAEIKNMKLLKFSSKPISSISTNNNQDSYNYIDKNEMLQVKNEHSTQSFVNNNEAELNNKEKNNINLQENKHVYKFPEWWYNHMHDEVSTVQKKSIMNKNVKSKAIINDTRSLITSDKSILHKYDDYSEYSFKSLDTNKNSTQTSVDIVNLSNNNDKMFPDTKTHSNEIYPDW